MAGEMLELREALQGGGFGRGGDRGGRGGGRGGFGGRGGRGGGRGRGSFEQEDPATVSLEAVGVFRVRRFDSTHDSKAAVKAGVSLGRPRNCRGSVMELRQRLRIHAKTTVYAVVLTQILAGIALSAMFALGGESRASYSVLTGTLCGALPNFYLALKMFSMGVDSSAQQMLRAIYIGESLKIVASLSRLLSD